MSNDMEKTMDTQTNEKPLTNVGLYIRQMEMLKAFLERGAISKEQYEHSAGELTRKMNPKKALSEMTKEELWQLFPIFLTSHKPEWERWYADEQALLSSVFPAKEIVRISHIGSTAIPAIWAKNIVDIMVETTPDSDWQNIKALLQQSGYLCMSEDERWISFNKGYTEQGFADKVFHLHLRHAGDNHELYFRDYLLEHPAVAKEYETLKLSLWKKYEHNRDAYTDAKGKFIGAHTAEAQALYQGRYAVSEDEHDRQHGN